ncbi:MAG: polyphosphate kinase 1 [Acidobacteria bacterium]|nr:polyphosphate kinase 1 [Acidobacteriota bacterium]
MAKRSPGVTKPQQVRLDDPALYVNRELSLLKFQRRVLEEANDPTHPLLERVKFVSILGSNLDEFFMVRVAGIQNQINAGVQDTGPEGLTPPERLEAIRAEFVDILNAAHASRSRLFEELSAHGIHVVEYADLSPEQRQFADQYFLDTIYPVLTPLAFDPGRPFPHISNLSLNLSVMIRDREGEDRFARVKVPDTLPQLVPLQKAAKHPREVSFVWLEQVIQANLSALFPGMEIVESHAFHLTRDADTEIQEIEAEDLLESVEEGVRLRRFGAPVRLMVQPEMPDHVLDLLKTNLEADDQDVFRVQSPLALSRLRHLSSLDRPELKDPPFVPMPHEAFGGDDEEMFAAVRRHDILLHHPFDSFQPVVDFLRAAARDPHVLAIKMTLYRVGSKSPVVEALLEAMRNGKQVAVLVELKARFDEESNIEWARALEAEGVHVVYGLVGLKIHGKVALVVRQEGDVMRRYVHLSTGNYNAVTAHLYTDMGMFTADPDIGADASDLFNYLTGYSAKSDYRKLLVAPINLRSRFAALIHREIAHARAGLPARLIFKMNALVDDGVIRLLYEASRAGVKVDLIARGICCLRPGIPGVSDNITVRSIVGRFLEHSRIFYFANGGKDEIYLGSADLMQRNINRRVEVLFPVQRPALVKTLRDRVLAAYLNDNVKARLMQPGGTYVRAERGKARPVNSQNLLLAARSGR